MVMTQDAIDELLEKLDAYARNYGIDYGLPIKLNISNLDNVNKKEHNDLSDIVIKWVYENQGE